MGCQSSLSSNTTDSSHRDDDRRGGGERREEEDPPIITTMETDEVLECGESDCGHAARAHHRRQSVDCHPRGQSDPKQRWARTQQDRQQGAAVPSRGVVGHLPQIAEQQIEGNEIPHVVSSPGEWSLQGGGSPSPGHLGGGVTPPRNSLHSTSPANPLNVSPHAQPARPVSILSSGSDHGEGGDGGGPGDLNRSGSQGAFSLRSGDDVWAPHQPSPSKAAATSSTLHQAPPTPTRHGIQQRNMSPRGSPRQMGHQVAAGAVGNGVTHDSPNQSFNTPLSTENNSFTQQGVLSQLRVHSIQGESCIEPNNPGWWTELLPEDQKRFETDMNELRDHFAPPPSALVDRVRHWEHDQQPPQPRPPSTAVAQPHQHQQAKNEGAARSLFGQQRQGRSPPVVPLPIQ